MDLGAAVASFGAMEPRAVATLIARNHAELRTQLDRLDVLIDRLIAEDSGAGSEFYRQCDELCRALLMHIDLEDSVIAPLLRSHHPRGDAEAAELLRHHQAQRTWLTGILVRRGAPPTPEVLRSVRALAHVLRVDMEHEETQLAALC